MFSNHLTVSFEKLIGKFSFTCCPNKWLPNLLNVSKILHYYKKYIKTKLQVYDDNLCILSAILLSIGN